MLQEAREWQQIGVVAQDGWHFLGIQAACLLSDRKSTETFIRVVEENSWFRVTILIEVPVFAVAN